MTNRKLIAAIAGALLVTACKEGANNAGTDAPKTAPSAAQQSPAAPAPTPENTVAIVNGKPITKLAVEVLSSEIAQRRGGNNVPEDKIVDELIKREVLRQEAVTQKLTQDPSNAARLDNAERMMLSQMAAENFMNTAPITDEDLKKEYDQRTGAMKLTEYKARHILVETENAAKDIIQKLQKGSKFADLAKKLSKDPGSKDSGGDLGWFNPQQMVPPFASAVAALKNGETTQTPVQTQFGWHVIQREDSRDQPPPPFDSVKDQLRSMLQTQRLQQHIADLMAKAKVERLQQPKPEEKPAPEGAPAAPEAGKPETPSATLEAGKPQPPAPAQPEAPKPTAPDSAKTEPRK
jgi:peptidyl-prolyl cis-trans isomerase C